ncbi:MAG: copper chaperone PCu(A)C [Chloroflexi bacterium]|nr:copper chaperone PCu(A)C [Chloroflexota bacterium]MCA2001808.1 copper chaperone PCu(A)C [Chloroflexota bacterium]
MKKFFFSLIATSLLLAACGADMRNEVAAKDYWARSGVKDGNSAAYMLIQNGTDQDNELTGASSDAAQAVELHLSQMKADGTMEMIQQQSVVIPAGKALELKPGSYHVMLIGLTRDLKAGDEITLTLKFKNRADLTLTVPVKDAEGMSGGGMDGHQMP